MSASLTIPNANLLGIPGMTVGGLGIWMACILAAAGLAGLKPTRNVYFDGAHLSLEAARAGYGIAMGDLATVRDDLAGRRLVRLFEQTVPAAFPYSLVAPPEAEQPPAAHALEKWLIAEFAKKL